MENQPNLRLCADENFNGDIVRGILLRDPNVDLVRVQDVGLNGKDDSEILEWAAENNRIVLTHDKKTMTGPAFQRVEDGLPMCGLFIISSRCPIGVAIEEILMLIECSEQHEWNGRAVHLPL
jgi:hypothetical protein